jgi:hypothetical protein
MLTRLLNEEFHQSRGDPGLDITLLTRSRLPKKTWSKLSNAKSVTSEEQSSHSSRCYNCGGRGHHARDCPSPKQEGDKANFATKEDDSSSQFSHGIY